MGSPSTESVAAATAIVRKLTGNRYTWPPLRVRELYPVPVSGRIQLHGRPVRAVVSVKNYDTADDIDFTLTRAGHLLLDGWSNGCVSGAAVRQLDVTYEYGSEPSKLLNRAIYALAAEFDLADNNDGNCRLPERVTSVNRQGVSWTLIDPQDFLDNGRTGIYEVDLAMRAIGSNRARVRVFSQEHPPPDRLELEVLADPTP